MQQSVYLYSFWTIIFKQSNRPLAALALALALLLSFPQLKLFANALTASPKQVPAIAETIKPAVKQQFPENGIYLYGETAEREKLGQAYTVFEIRNDKLVGAFYMPRSSFDCFHGSLQGNQLALKVTNSYTQEAYAHAIALQAAEPVATGAVLRANTIGLDGFTPIGDLSNNDLQILKVCRNQFSF